MSVWKIGAANQSYAQAIATDVLGVQNIRRTLSAAGLDEVTFDHPSQNALTDDSAFVYGTSYIIWKDEARWFQGRMTTLPRDGEGMSENRTVVLAGPWWYFRENTYQQSWKVWDVSGEVLNNSNKSRVVLFQGADGNRCTQGAQIADVVDWLIAQGVPIIKGTIDDGVALPFDEQTNLKCADVVDTVLRWSPDFIAWFDYSTAQPTFHFRKRTNLATVSMAFAGISGLKITPRYDLQKPGVHLTYEKTHTANDKNYNTIETDVAGNPSALDTIYGVFDLQGSSRTRVSQKIVTEDFPDPEAPAAYMAWWKARVPWLAAIPDAQVTLHSIFDETFAGYTRYLAEGQIQDWMNKDAVKGFILAEADILIMDDDEYTIKEEKSKPLSFEVIATDAETRTYSKLTEFDSGESTPVGVAAALYATWSALHHEGSFRIEEEECLGGIRPGMALRITGGRPAWATMDALIQEVSESVDDGTTSVVFGPPKMVEADTLVGLFRALRARRFSWSYKARTEGETTGAGDVENSGPVPSGAGASGSGELRRLVVKGNTGEGEAEKDHKVDLAPSSIAHADPADEADRIIKPREVWIPQLNGATPENQLVYKLRQVLASEPYHADQLVGALIRLKELLDVQITAGTLAEGQGIKWDATLSKWVNGAVTAEGSVENEETEDYTLTLLPPGGKKHMPLVKSDDADHRVKWDWLRGVSLAE